MKLLIFHLFWKMIPWLVFYSIFCLKIVSSQPEYTTPGGILITNCHKGCTEIVVHESNCHPPCDVNLYERCVLDPRNAEPSCSHHNTTGPPESKRSYVCRCHPCLYRNEQRVCVPVCPS